MADYKIQLGVKLDTNDIVSQINEAEKKADPIKIRIDAETKELTNTIKDALKSLTTGTKNALTLDTTKLESSLNDVKSTIIDIKNVLGTLDSGKGMKSLVSSINSISTALDKASSKFDELAGDLKSLSGKDFNLNFGITMGGSNSVSRNAAYGNKVRSETLPQLKQQAEAMEKYLKEYYKTADGFNAVQKLMQGTNAGKGKANLYDLLPKMLDANGSLSSQMSAWKEYIALIKEASSIRGIDISHITSQFSKSADDLIKDAQDIQTGAKEMDESFDKLKQIFGGGNNINADGLSTQLDSIVADLGEIKTAIIGLSSGISIDGLTQSFDRLSESIELLVKNCTTAKQVINDTVGSSLGGSASKSNSGVKNLNNDLKQVTITADNTADAIDSVKNVMSSMKFNTASIDAATKDLEEMNVVIKEVTAKQGKNFDITVKGINDVGEAVEVVKRFNAETGNFEIIGTKIAKPFNEGAEAAKRFKKETSTIEKIRFNMDTDSYYNQFSQMESNFNQLSDVNKELRASYNEVENAYKELISIYNSDSTGDEIVDRERLIQAEEKYAEALKKTNNLIKIKNRKEAEGYKAQKLTDDIDIFKRKIDAWLETNSAATKKFGSTLLGLKAQAEGCDRVTLNHLEKQFTKVDKEAEKAGLKMRNFGDRIKDQIKQYSTYLSVAEVFMYVTQAMRSMFEQVKAIDSAMTELKKVTDETDVSYNNFLNNTASRAKEIGTTIDGLVQSTADFARLGYEFSDAQGLAEVANIYAVVGDDIDSVETATQSLISTLTAFKDEASNISNEDFALSIVDKMNEVANNYAISSGGIGDALQRSASSMMAANNSLDETIALITAANTVVQDPDSVGTAFKTISMRIRGAKTELEEAGLETEGMADSVSTLRSEIMALSGVDIMLNDNEFKSTYQIMEELANKWQDLTDIQQASVTELIAGKRQGNIVSSLMNNFDIAEDALKTSLGSSGSAMKEHAKYMDSIEAKLSQLKAAWQGLSQTFMDSDFLKGGIDTLKVFIEILDKLIESFGTFGTIGLGIGVFGLVKNFSNIKSLLSIFKALPPELRSVKALFKDIGVTFGKSAAGIAAGAGIAVAAIGLLYNAYKNANEEASRLSQEAVDSSNKFLDSASAFEQAYIKYSGRTDLTSEEESELSTAIQGTVDALGNKSSALQKTVDASSDYLASLEAIKNAELEASKDAADKKKQESEKLLKESAIGWETLDGSEVNIKLGLGGDEAQDAAIKLAEKYSDYFGKVTKGKAMDKISSLTLSADADTNEIIDYYNTLLDYQQELVDAELVDTDAYEQVSAAIEKMSKSIDTYIDGVYDAAKAQYQLENGIPKTVDEYLKMREAILSDIKKSGASYDTRLNIANSLDSEYGQIFDLSSAEAQARKFVGLIKGYGNGTKDGTNEIGTVETFLNMRTAINNNECTVGQYISEFDKVTSMAGGFTEDERNEFNSTFELDTDSIKKQYDEVYDYLSKKDIVEDSEINNFLNGLSASELQAVVNLKTELDWENDSFEEIEDKIQEEAKLIEAISFDINIESVTEKLESLSTAMSESVSGSGLSTTSITAIEDMFSDLDSYDPSKLFERTANGIRLNTTELSKLNSEYKNTNVDGLENKIDALGEKYLQTKEELSDLTYGTDEYNQKARDLEGIEAQINATEELIAQFDGLTNAYQEWQRAESSGNQRDMYENVLSGFETVKDELSRGWADDGTVEFLELITGKTDLAGKSGKELKKVWNSIDDTIKHTTYSVKDFFTVDEDGNSTSKGVYNFLDAIGQMEEEKFGKKDVVQRKDGNIVGFDFQIVGGNEAIAEALGISEELVDIMVRAADDAGFVVSMDGTYQQLDIIKEKAQEAAKALKDTFKKTEFDFDLSTGDESSILGQYDEALKIWKEFKNNKNEDGTVNMDVEGAEEAYTLISTLQTMVDQLSEPVYMELDASQVEKDMQTPLSKLQEYETLVQTEHQLQLKGTDTSEIDKSQEEILDYFENLEPEIKAQLGIDDYSREELQKKLEAGEIEIPATVDLQVEMNNTMRDMVNVALYNAGVIDKEELEARVDVNLYANEVDASEVVNDIDSVLEESDLSKKQKVTIKAFAEVFGVDNIEDLDKRLNELDDEQIQVVANVIGRIDVEELKNAIDGIEDEKKVEAIATAIGKGDVEELKNAVNNLEGKDVEAIAKAFGYDDVNSLKGAIDNLSDKDVEAIAKTFGITDVDSLKGAIDRLKDKDVDAVANVDGKDDVNNLQSAIDNLKGKTVTIWAQVKKIASNLWDKVTGGSDVNGTANVNGTTGKAFKEGSWGTKNSGTALVGELGRETLVRNGRYYTIGNDGAEFIKYQKGDIIFNHKQTEELFKNGRVTSGGGRAKALASGTAFSSGTGGGFWEETTTTTITKNPSGSKKPSSSKPSSNKTKTKTKTKTKNKSKDTSKDFKETFDWIEVAIDRIERAIDKLDLKANSVYKSWSTRNEALTEQIGKVGEKIDLQQQAYDKYMKKAESINISDSYKKKVQDGTIKIEDITNEKTAEKVKQYKEWYEKALDCQDAIDELREKEAELYAQRFDNVQSQYDGILQGYEHTENMIDEYIAQAEAKGHIVSKKYYEGLIANEILKILELKDNQSELLAKRQEYYDAMSKDMTDKEIKNSEKWIEMSNDIDEVTQSIEESNTAMLEYENSIRDIEWSVFDLIQERISAVSEEADFLIELMSNDKLFDDKGKLTEQGAATMALHAQKYNNYMYQADDYGAEIADIDTKIASGEYDSKDQEVINRRNELLELQREMILAANDEKEAIRDLTEEGVNLELDSLQELIDKKNEELESEKDLYEYQKKVKEQTEEIASLEKQMSAYSGDDSEEAKAKIQELKVSLEDAKAELQETEWDKYISDTSALLDNLYLEYENILNQRLDNVDLLLQQVVDGVNASMGEGGTIDTALGESGAIATAIASAVGENGSIKSILNGEVTAVGTTLSSAMNNIWSTGDGNIKSVLSTYGDGFQGKQITTNAELSKIKADVSAMVDDIDKDAEKDILANKTLPSSKKDPTENPSGKPEPPTPTPTPTPKPTPAKKPSGDGKAKVGDKVKFVSGKYYYDSYGKSPTGSKYQGKQVYITKINKKGSHPYHISTGKKLGNGDLGWLKLSQLSGYATGKKNFLSNEVAWTQENGKEFIVRPSDGAILTPIAKGDSVLNANASRNIWNMANSPTDFIKDNLNLGGTNIPNNSNVNNNVTQNFESVVFSMPNVHSYNELLTQMQKDKNFEKLVLSMSIDRLAGKSSLAKNKSIR